MLRRHVAFASIGLALLPAIGLSPRLVAIMRPHAGYAISVTPDNANDPIRDAGGTGYSTVFTATNTGTLSGTWYFDCGACTSISPSSAFLKAGWTTNITAYYDAGTSNFTLTLNTDGPALDQGTVNVIVRPVITITAPQFTSDTTGVVYSRMPLVQARLFPNDANLDTTTLVVIVGTDTVTSLTRRNRGLVEWELDSLRQLSSGVLKKFYVRICLTNGQCQSAQRYLKLDDSGKPWVSFAGMPLEAHGSVFSAPFGPGLSVSGADVETGFSVQGYVSMGMARSAGLVYSTRQSHPRALVNTDIELTWPTGNPDRIKAVLIGDAGARMDSVVDSSGANVCSASVGRRCRVALQGDFAASSFSGATRKWLRVEVSVTYSGTTKTTTDSTEVVLVDRRSSSYGSGWYMAGLMRLDSEGNDMILVGPTGSATIYRGYGGVYLSPPGDYSSRLVYTGSLWELRFRAGGMVVFDSQGRQTKVVDIDANQVTVAYSSTTERVTSITDPTGKSFTLSYDGSNKISTITNNGIRSHKVSVNGSNLLTFDSVSSTGYTESFKYASSGSNSAILLRYRANAVGDSVTVAYARLRPIEDTLPAVVIVPGDTLAKPIIRYAPQETRALGVLRSADSVYLTITDPRGNWTRTALNRWGSPLLSWDALGTLSRASYTPDGLLAWSEGKVADSTRVYHNYDAAGHLVRSSLSANVLETRTPLEFSVEGEGEEHQVRGVNGGGGERAGGGGGGEGPATAVHGGVQAADSA